MNKLLLSLVAVLAMSSALATENSVYAWGPWSEGIKPAAGPVYVAPAPVSEPQVDLRESLALLRDYNNIQPPAQTGVFGVNTSIPIINTLHQPGGTPPPSPGI